MDQPSMAASTQDCNDDPFYGLYRLWCFGLDAQISCKLPWKKDEYF
jgi:hypothetical protein